MVKNLIRSLINLSKFAKSSNSKNFCHAPFDKIYFGANGIVKPCCGTTFIFGNINDTSVKEIYNSNQAQEFRKNFLDGKYPTGCENCETNFNDTNNISDFQKFYNKNNSSVKIQTIIEDQKPTFVDILVSNNCNFACIGCGSNLSSTWAKNYTDVEQVINQDIRNITPSKEWNVDIDPIIEYILEHKHSINTIHLNGGEPFMQSQFFKLFDALIDNKLTETIEINTHTNGSISTYKGKNIVNDYFSKFKNVSIIMSLDHYGNRGHYIRYPLQEEKWLHNYNQIKQVANVSIQTCYSVFNCQTFDLLEQWFLDNNIPLTSWDISIWHGPFAYTPYVIKDNVKYMENANNVLKKLRTKNNLYEFLNANPRNDIEILKNNFKNSINLWDKKRNTNFLKTFPELSELIC